jgi:hypothetical protein
MVHHQEVLTSMVLTRGQQKALAYAKKMQAAGTIDVLQESGNKTDKSLAHELFMQERRAKARGNGNAIYQMVKNRYGSDESVRGVKCPDSAKTAALKVWVADCHAAIRGKDDSTEKAVASREAGFNARFGDLFLMIAEL